MPKLTDTTNDQLHKRGPGRPPKVKTPTNGGLHIVPEHEPLGEGGFQLPPVAFVPQVNYSISQQEQTKNDAALPKQPLKIALIGTAPSSRMLAPYHDPSWTIWACSPGNMGALPRVDAWFEIHGSLLWPENKHYGEPYIKFLSELKIPVYMQDKRYCTNAIPLPKDELVKEFGPYYFTSSFSWMMAYAMHRGCTEMALYGIDMASRDEYILQRPGAYHFFNEARKRGIKISAPYESDIMQPPGLYGYSEVTPFGRKLIARRQELKDRLNGMRQQRDGLTQNITYLEGAMEDLDYVEQIWSGAQNNPHPDMDSGNYGIDKP
jgi:hypothetical protein